MTNLDILLLKGASEGITEENLAELRYTILTKGIPANSEGMVSFPTTKALATTINNFASGPYPHDSLPLLTIPASSPNSESTSG